MPKAKFGESEDIKVMRKRIFLIQWPYTKKCSGSEGGKVTGRNKRNAEKIQTIRATLFFSKETGKEIILKKWRKDWRLVQMWTQEE